MELLKYTEELNNEFIKSLELNKSTPKLIELVGRVGELNLKVTTPLNEMLKDEVDSLSKEGAMHYNRLSVIQKEKVFAVANKMYTYSGLLRDTEKFLLRRVYYDYINSTSKQFITLHEDNIVFVPSGTNADLYILNQEQNERFDTE